MSKESESVAGAGLLSKVVKFVSNPTKDWKDLDEIESNIEEDPTAQQVRERIERKRRNDFIRKTEFAQLRKIIHSRRKQRQPNFPTNTQARNSDAGSSRLVGAPGVQNRSGTLQKIDEIEKQMSKQWWQGDKAGAETQLVDGVEISGDNAAVRRSSGGERAAAADSGFFLTGSSLFFADEVSKQYQEVKLGLAHADAVDVQNPVVARWLRMLQIAAYFGFEEEFVHESEIEEAAILFASDRAQDAEKALVEVIRANSANKETASQEPVWMALFDLYRATGQQERFDIVAIDFAKLFGKSAPTWLSLPELLGEGKAVTENKRSFSWISPPELTVQSIATAAALRSRAAAPYQLNWARLHHIHDDVLVPLTEFVNALAEQEGMVEFTGAEHLMNLTLPHTESGNTQGLRQWWLLRLALLRLMNRQEDFEMVALDFTVTYEESPPAWTVPKAVYSDEAGKAQAANSQLANAQSRLQDSDRTIELHKAELCGRLDNDVTAQLDQAVAELAEDAPVAIDCGYLISIDFPAAGSVLNWAALQQSKGRLVAFTNLHRLVAVFFNIIGINEHAKVVPRKD